MRSSEVLQRTVTLSGGRISAVTLGQRLEVKLTPDPQVIKIRVVDPTPEGAAELANGVTLAYREVVIDQDHKVIQRMRSHMLSHLMKTSLARIDAELAGRPNDPGLREQRNALAAQLPQLEGPYYPAEAAVRVDATCGGTSPRCPTSPSSPGPVASSRWRSGYWWDSSYLAPWRGGVRAGRDRRPGPRRLSRGRSCHPRPDQQGARDPVIRRRNEGRGRDG
jgi:hypothetical protein